MAAGYVERNLGVSFTASVLVLAPNGIIWAPPEITINAATGIQTPIGYYSSWGMEKPGLHPNGKWIYYTRSGSTLVKGDVSSGTFQFLYEKYGGSFPICAGTFFSADGNRLLTGCGTFFRTTASSSDDIRYTPLFPAGPGGYVTIWPTDQLRSFGLVAEFVRWKS